ncbi:MAG TPA: hypothetical protein VF516_02305, partial [Kofleriaceae bacterium]
MHRMPISRRWSGAISAYRDALQSGGHLGPRLARTRAMTVDLQDISIPIGDIELEGTLAIPTAVTGLVMFAHGSGSSRHSPRNRRVASLLHERHLATLLFDLLTVDEERIDAVDATLRFDVEMLAERLVAATDSITAAGHSRG